MEQVEELSLELFQILLKTIRKNGVDGTLRILRTKTEDIDIEDTFILEVAKIVCEEFSLSVNDLLYEKYVRGDNKYAIGFVIYYLYKEFSIGDLQKKGLFKYKDKSVLSRYRQLIDKLDAKHKADMPYLKIKDILDKKITEIKK